MYKGMERRTTLRAALLALRINGVSASPPFVKRIPLLLTILLSPIWAPLLSWAGQNNHAYASTLSMTGLHVAGNEILNGSNQVVQLRGVDRAGTEYACIQGWGIFDGPSDATSVQAIASWHVNAVRIPLNEDCWLNINGVNSAYGGSTYQNAIVNYVNLLNAYGIAAIVELHWNAPGNAQATAQQPMPDQDHAPAFWTSVANTFKANSSVIFDLFNEPYPDNNQNTTAAWQCLLNGGGCSGVSYQAAGMQELVNIVRGTGATNIIMTGGVQYAGNLTQWLQYKPSDPTGNLAASWHNYNFGQCTDSACWNSVVAPVAQQAPLIVGEIGENDCAHGYIDSLMPWLDAHKINYLAWAWDTTSCSSFPALISNYNGTPTNFGAGYQQHLASLFNSNPTPGPTATATNTPVPPTATKTPASPTATRVPASPTATNTPASLALTWNRVSESAARIKAGMTEAFTATVTANQSIANELVDFEVYNSAGAKVWQAYRSPVAFTANKAKRFTVSWTTPSTLASGSYTLAMGVFTSTWSTCQAWNGTAAIFNVTNGTTTAHSALARIP